MSDDRLEELFQELVELSPESRRERLESVRSGEPGLFDELNALLSAFESAPGFLRVSTGWAPPNPGIPARGALPDRLGKYTVEQEIGRGGMGIVYLARDPDLERPVAIKVLPRRAISRDGLEGLWREARVLASVNHPHVAQVHSIEEIPSSRQEPDAILTMEYVPGTTLAGRLLGGPIPCPEALDLGRQIAAALEAAHQRRIVHRDLKPQNIRVTPEGWVKVLDFGLARVLAPLGPSEGERNPSAGTPGYMSPEQCRGETVDFRSDLWSFGAVLYECLAGEPVMRADDLAGLLEANRRGVVDLRALSPLVSQNIETLLRTCLEPDPERRTMSATQVRRILEEELLRLRATAILGTPAHTDGSEHRPSRPGNLPHPWSSFVGRAEPLRQMEQALAEGRLVTLTGPGGVGKTRASQELARRMETIFTGGIWFVDLSVIADGLEVPATIVRTLRAGGALPAGPSDAPHRAVVNAFRGERGLLLLDNCEHLVDDVSRFVGELLAIPSAVSVLATSRQPLGLPGERVVSLPPLEVPDETEDGARPPGSRPRDHGSPDGEVAESVRLFLDRARARHPEFTAGERAEELLGRICRRLDGLPLAIELAASHVRSFPLEELLRLIESGRPLSAVSGVLPERHRSLHSLVDWSFALLSPPERALLRRLSTFRGGCTFLAAESVCGGWGGIETWEVYALLARLVERSLVEPDAQSGVPEPAASSGSDPAGAAASSESGVPSPPARYRLLETIRAYAAERLQEDPAEASALTNRYLDHLREIATLREEERTPLRSAWIRRIAPEYSNLLHGLDLALSGGRRSRAFALAEPLGCTWVQTGQWIDGTRWMDRILEARARGTAAANGTAIAQESAIAPEDQAAEVRVLSLAGLLAAIQGRADRAGPILEEALALGEALAEPEPLAQAHEAAGVAAWRAGRLDEAQGHIERSRRCFEEARDWGGVAVAIGNLGILDCTRGELGPARRSFEEYLRLARGMKDPLAIAAALGNLGWIAGTQGRFDEARSLLEEAVAIQRRNRDLPSAAMILQNLGEFLIRAGLTEEARLRLRESSRIRLKLGDRQGIVTNLVMLGRLAEREERHADGAEILAGVLHLVHGGGSTFRPDMLALLQASRTALEQRLGAAEMNLAVGRGEARDLRSLLAFADPGGFGANAPDPPSVP
jgi:predicted ATPase